MTLEELQLHDQLAKAMIKIHNLHIALNKKVAKNKNQKVAKNKNQKVAKNKNQKEEINLLLKQKEELQNKLIQANRVIKIGIDNSLELVKCLDRKDEVIKKQETIISYLESKLT